MWACPTNIATATVATMPTMPTNAINRKKRSKGSMNDPSGSSHLSDPRFPWEHLARAGVDSSIPGRAQHSIGETTSALEVGGPGATAIAFGAALARERSPSAAVWVVGHNLLLPNVIQCGLAFPPSAGLCLSAFAKPLRMPNV